MARVPRGPELTPPTGASTVFQSGNAPSGAFGAGGAHALTSLGGSVQRAGGAFAAIAQEQRIQDTAREAKAGDLEYQQGVGALLRDYHDLKGKDAIAAKNKVIRDLKALRQKAIGGASNSRVGGLLRNSTGLREVRTLNNIAAFDRGVKFEYDNELSLAVVNQSIRTAAGDPDDPDLLMAAVDDIRIQVGEGDQRNGWGPVITEDKLSQAYTNLFDTTARAALNAGDWPRALAIHSQAKDYNIDGRVMSELAKAIGNARETEMVQVAVQGVIEETGRDQAAARTFIRENYDGERQNEINSLYTTVMAQNSRARFAGEEERWRRVWDAESIFDVAPTDKAELELNGRWGAVEQEFRRRATGTQRVTNQQWLAANYYSKTIAEQHRIPLSDIAPHVSTEKYNQIEAERLEGIKPFLSQTNNQYITQRMLDLGFDDPTDDDRDVINKFREVLEQWVNQAQEVADRKLRDDEVQDIVDRLVIKVRTQGTFESLIIPGPAIVPVFGLRQEEAIEALIVQKQTGEAAEMQLLLTRQLGVTLPTLQKVRDALKKEGTSITVFTLRARIEAARRAKAAQ